MTAFELRSAAGVIPLAANPGDASPWRLAEGTSGLGLAPTAATFADSAVAGGSHVSTRVGMREPLLRIEISGETEADLWTRIAQLARAARSRAPVPGVPAAVWARRSSPIALVATGSHTSPASPLWLMMHLVDGGQNAYDDGGELSLTWDLSMKATWPYWQSAARRTVANRTGTLLTDVLTNDGDADTPLSVTINGPVPAGTTVVVSAAGAEVGRFTQLTAFATGSRVLARGDAGWTYKQGSTSRYAQLGPALTLPVIPAGASVSVEVVPPGGETWSGSVSLGLTPMFEVIR